MRLAIAREVRPRDSVTDHRTNQTPPAKRSNDGPQNPLLQNTGSGVDGGKNGPSADTFTVNAQQDNLANITPQFSWLEVIIVKRAADF